MTEMFGEAWSPMSVPDLAPDDDDDESISGRWQLDDSDLSTYYFFNIHFSILKFT